MTQLPIVPQWQLQPGMTSSTHSTRLPHKPWERPSAHHACEQRRDRWNDPGRDPSRARRSAVWIGAARRGHSGWARTEPGRSGREPRSAPSVQVTSARAALRISPRHCCPLRGYTDNGRSVILCPPIAYQRVAVSQTCSLPLRASCALVATVQESGRRYGCGITRLIGALALKCPCLPPAPSPFEQTMSQYTSTLWDGLVDTWTRIVSGRFAVPEAMQIA